jgi:hypothetical protein
VQPEPVSSGRPSLAAVQTAVMSLITGRGGESRLPEAGTLNVGDSRASADERLHVYAHMYRARIVEALESQFPRLSKRLGPEAFAELAAAYIADEPSRHPSLRYVGQRLPAWLATREPAASTLVGLARLEWARADVFDLADEPMLTLAAVRAWPMERFGELPLGLVTAHRLVSAPRGTAALWDALAGELAAGAEASVALAGEESFLVWRDGTVVYHRLVDEAEGAALALASQTTRFGLICECLLATHGEEAAVAQAYAWMSTWLADGLLSCAPLQ